MPRPTLLEGEKNGKAPFFVFELLQKILMANFYSLIGRSLNPGRYGELPALPLNVMKRTRASHRANCKQY